MIQKKIKNISSDKLQPIREVLKLGSFYLQDVYIALTLHAVDEQLLCFKGKCSFRQYAALKLGEGVIEIRIICDSKTLYANKTQIYSGKNEKVQD